MSTRKYFFIAAIIVSCLSGCYTLKIPDLVSVDSLNIEREAKTVSKTYTFSDCDHLKNKMFDLIVNSDISRDKKILTAIDISSLDGTEPKLTVKKFELAGGIDQFVRDRLVWHLRDRCGATIGTGQSGNTLTVNVIDAFSEVEHSDFKKEGDFFSLKLSYAGSINMKIDNISHLNAKAKYRGRDFAYKNPGIRV